MSSEGILSEDEYSALLDTVAGDVEVSQNGVDEAGLLTEVYDFANPDTHIRSIIPGLLGIMERFADDFRAVLLTMLRQELEVTPRDPQIHSLQEFMSTLDDPCSINVLTLAPLSGQAYLVFDRALAFALVDIFFGGNGLGSNTPASRVFTDTELRMIRRLRNRAANALVEAWGETLPEVAWQLVGEEFNPQFIGNKFATETTIVTTFEVALNETRGLVHLGISYPMLEPLRTSLLSAIRNPNATEERDRSDRWRQAIERAPLAIRCPFVELELSVREVLALKVGDVIPVELPEDVDLEIEGVPVWRGPYGVYRGKRAVRLQDLSDKDHSTSANEFITGEQSNNG